MDDDLVSRIHSLPPEFFDQIRTEVLFCDLPGPANHTTLNIFEDWKYPIGFQINKQTRKMCGTLFQGATIVFTSPKIFELFWRSMDGAFLKSEVRLLVKFPDEITVHL